MTPHVKKGLSLLFHQDTSASMTRVLRDLLDACPERDGKALSPGQTYYQPQGSGRSRVFTVVRSTASRAQVIVRIHGEDAEKRLFQGDMRGASFRELSPLLVSLLGVTHEDVVRAAIQEGLQVAPQARREYPDLFVDVPERVREYDVHRLPSATADDGLGWLRKALQTNFWAGMRDPGDLTAGTVDGWIEQAHRDLSRIVDEGARRRAAGADMEDDFLRYERRYLDQIERWRWLRPLLEPGGVFHVAKDVSAGRA